MSCQNPLIGLQASEDESVCGLFPNCDSQGQGTLLDITGMYQANAFFA